MAFVPHFMTILAVRYDPSFNVATGVTQAVSYIATSGLFPLGSALIAAALVMKYVGHTRGDVDAELRGDNEPN